MYDKVAQGVPDRLSALYGLEQEYSVWDQAKRELKHIPLYERKYSWRPLAPIRKATSDGKPTEQIFSSLRIRLFYKLPRKRPLEARAWAALDTFKHKKWKLHRIRPRARLRTPSSGRTQGLTFALPEHLLRPSDHNISRYGLERPSSRKRRKKSKRPPSRNPRKSRNGDG